MATPQAKPLDLSAGIVDAPAIDLSAGLQGGTPPAVGTPEFQQMLATAKNRLSQQSQPGFQFSDSYNEQQGSPLARGAQGAWNAVKEIPSGVASLAQLAAESANTTSAYHPMAADIVGHSFDRANEARKAWQSGDKSTLGEAAKTALIAGQRGAEAIPMIGGVGEGIAQNMATGNEAGALGSGVANLAMLDASAPGTMANRAVGAGLGAVARGATGAVQKLMGTTPTAEVPRALLTAGTKPPAAMSQMNVEKAMSGFPDIAKTAQDLGMDPQNAVEAHQAAQAAERKIWTMYETAKSPVNSAPIDPMPIQQTMMAAAKEGAHPTAAQMDTAASMAQDLQGIKTLGQLDDHLRAVNQELHSLWDKSSQGVYDAESQFRVRVLHAEEIAATHQLHEALLNNAGPEVADLRTRYGQVAEAEQLFNRAARAQRVPNAQADVMPPLAQTGKVLTPLKAGRAAIEAHFMNPDTLIAKAFDVYQPQSWPQDVMPNPVAGINPRQLGSGGARYQGPANISNAAAPSPQAQTFSAHPGQHPPLLPAGQGMTPADFSNYLRNQSAASKIQPPQLPPGQTPMPFTTPRAGMPGGTPLVDATMGNRAQLPPGPPGQGRMTVLPPGASSPGGIPTGVNPSTGTGPFPTPNVGPMPPAAAFPAAHPPPIVPEAFLALENLPHEALMKNVQGLGFDRLQKLSGYIDATKADYPRLQQAVNDVLSNWQALKNMRH